MTTPVVQLRDVSKSYRSAGREGAGVRGISFDVREGELVLLLGPSGSGKTTILTLMAGLLAPTGGTVAVDGRELALLHPAELQRLRAQKIGVVFQSFNLLDTLTVSENLQIALGFAGWRGFDASRRALELLGEFGIAHLARERPSRLSQGEQQRAAIARAVACEPALILADEPTASLDSGNGLRVIELLRRYACRGGRAVVVATHDLRLRECADRIFRLRDGEILPPGAEFDAGMTTS
jgi:putative ABC transport system ATP-binding protein